MAEGLSGYTVAIFGRLRGLFAWPTMMVGAGTNGPVALKVNSDGSLVTAGGSTDSGLPYGADEQVLTNVVGGPGPTVIVYKKAGVTVKTRTLTYTGSGPTDVLTHTVDS